VLTDEASELKRTIAARLSGLVDPARGQAAISSVLPRESAYRGPYVEEAPDLLVNFVPPYRTSFVEHRLGRRSKHMNSR